MIKNTKFLTFETFDIVMLLAFGVLNTKNLNNITRILTNFFHSHIFSKNTNNVTKTKLPNDPYHVKHKC